MPIGRRGLQRPITIPPFYQSSRSSNRRARCGSGGAGAKEAAGDIMSASGFARSCIAAPKKRVRELLRARPPRLNSLACEKGRDIGGRREECASRGARSARSSKCRFVSPGSLVQGAKRRSSPPPRHLYYVIMCLAACSDVP